MKRFMIDLSLILLLILLSTQVSVQDFHQYSNVTLTFDNHASQLALQCSELIVKVVEIFFQLFYILITQWIG